MCGVSETKYWNACTLYVSFLGWQFLFDSKGSMIYYRETIGILACSLVPTPLSTALSFFHRYGNLVQSWSHLFWVIREHFCSTSVQMEYLVNSQQVFRFIQCQEWDQSLHSEKSRPSWGRKPLHNWRINDLGPSGLPTVVVRLWEKRASRLEGTAVSVLTELVPQTEDGTLFRLNTLCPFNPKRCAPFIAHNELSTPS